MWFLFGFITLGVACATSLLLRRETTWRGTPALVDRMAYQYAVTTYQRRYSFSHRRATSVRVGVACTEGFTFSLRPEGMLDAWSKAVGLVQECQTGDVEFDRDFYILSDDPVLHRLLQTDSGLRGAVERAFKDCSSGLGAPQAIYVHGGRLSLRANPHDSDPDAVTAACPTVVAALTAIADRLNRGGVGLVDNRDPFPRRAACFLGISTGLAINGGIELLHMDWPTFPALADSSAPEPVALAIAAAFILALAAVALQWMGRSARTHLVLIELLIAGGFGATVSAYAELRDYNIDYDNGAVRMITTRVAEKYTTNRRHGGYNYHLVLAGWPEPRDRIDFDIYSDLYNRVSVGSPMLITEHPGALGWPWTDGIRSE